MIIAKNSHEIITITPDPLGLIETAGSTCYKSDGKGDLDRPVRYASASHGPTLEVQEGSGRRLGRGRWRCFGPAEDTLESLLDEYLKHHKETSMIEKWVRGYGQRYNHKIAKTEKTKLDGLIRTHFVCGAFSDFIPSDFEDTSKGRCPKCLKKMGALNE